MHVLRGDSEWERPNGALIHIPCEPSLQILVPREAALLSVIPPTIGWAINQAEESSTLRDGELGAAGPESAVTQDVVLPSASLQNSTSQETATHEDPACAVTPRSQTPTARAPQSNAYARGKLITLSGLEDLSDSSDEGAD
eukprot:2661138-Pleurochrysis_carterae.AAC.4